ncbi:ABC transporter [Lentzea guizhouensis]|uniref:ABC transporter n=1 Tax=Lentzea guizhouensis TaxID=1586287 RepID=A0A1B2HML5_9PSEU|nr:ABC transporter ATP-binding protein [Lentzea guizhouensis]ANZ38958.1 ABC transporter [Lentzea guizhouensis]
MGRAALAGLRLTWQAGRAGTMTLLVIAALGGAAVPVAAWLGKLLIDEIARGRAADERLALALALGTALVGSCAAVLTYAGTYVGARVQRAVNLHVEDELNRSVNDLVGLRNFENPVFHDRLRLAAQGAQSAPSVLTEFSIELVRKTLTIAGFVGALLAVWPFMGVLLVIAAVPAFFAQLAISRRHAATVETMMNTVRRQSYYRSLITESQAAKEIRLFGLGDLLRARSHEALASSSGAELAVRRRNLVVESGFSLLNAVVAAIGTAVVVVGAVRGTVSIGDVSLFIAAVASLQGAFTSLIMQFGQVTESLKLFRHFVDLAGSAPDLVDGTTEAPELREGIELRDVWFRYDDESPWVLQGVTCTIPAGASVGLVGANGAGKSTLVKLLCRMYDPVRGSIHWDGTDLRELSAATLRRRTAAVFQDFMQYDLTAAENIGVGDLSGLDDRRRIEQAAAVVEIDEKIRSLPQGYRTLLSQSFVDFAAGAGFAGVNFSGGQWQRLAIARSLMRRDADFMIMDEPSSGLDADAEHQLGVTLRTLRAGRTSLLISHRLNTLRDADRIVVLAGGVVAEQGSHDELMTAAGEYARLFRLQASSYQDERVALP